MARRILLTGIQGSGKTTLLKEIYNQGVDCTVISGSDAIRHVMGCDDLSDFDKLPTDKRTDIRGQAVDYLIGLSRTRAHPLIIDGHLILRNRETGKIEINWNEHDERLYTEVVVLSIEAETILQRRLGDTRERALNLEDVIEELNSEDAAVKRFITNKPITFIKQSDLSLGTEQLRSVLEPQRRIKDDDKMPRWLSDPNINEANLLQKARKLEIRRDQTVILIDADRTLTPLDSAAELYSVVDSLSWDSFCAGFRFFGYTFEAFREAVIATSAVPASSYRKACLTAADSIHLYPRAVEMLSGLHSGSGYPLIITCGSLTIWRRLLDLHGFHQIPIFGGSHFEVDDFLIGKNEKGVLARFFKERGHPLIAIGDSEVDEQMMQISDVAIVAHNYKHNRDLLPGLKEKNNIRQWSQTGESEMISNYNSITVEQLIQMAEDIRND